jgi:hypothetical protein
MPGTTPATLAEIRQLVNDSRPARNRDGYPLEVRRRVVEWARYGRESGLSFHAIATSVGLSRRTLRAWCGEQGQRAPVLSPAASSSSEAGAWLPVEVEPPPPSLGLRWVTPSGHTVEGLGLNDVVHLLQVVA